MAFCYLPAVLYEQSGVNLPDINSDMSFPYQGSCLNNSHWHQSLIYQVKIVTFHTYVSFPQGHSHGQVNQRRRSHNFSSSSSWRAAWKRDLYSCNGGKEAMGDPCPLGKNRGTGLRILIPSIRESIIYPHLPIGCWGPLHSYQPTNGKRTSTMGTPYEEPEGLVEWGEPVWAECVEGEEGTILAEWNKLEKKKNNNSHSLKSLGRSKKQFDW